MTGQQLFENDNTLDTPAITWANMPGATRALLEIAAASITAQRDLDTSDVTIPATAETVSIRGMTVPAALALVAAGVSANAARGA